MVFVYSTELNNKGGCFPPMLPTHSQALLKTHILVPKRKTYQLNGMTMGNNDITTNQHRPVVGQCENSDASSATVMSLSVKMLGLKIAVKIH